MIKKKEYNTLNHALLDRILRMNNSSEKIALSLFICQNSYQHWIPKGTTRFHPAFKIPPADVIFMHDLHS